MNNKYNKQNSVICAVRQCSYTQNDPTKRRRLYTFPRELERAEVWAVSCGRTDLLNQLGTLHISHRVCEDHFEECMFKSRTHTQLLPLAKPTVFNSPGASSDQKQSYSSLPVIKTIAPTANQMSVAPTARILNADSQISILLGGDMIQIPFIQIQNPAPILETNAIQTSQVLTVPTGPSTNEQYQQKLLTLVSKTKNLTSLVKTLVEQLESAHETISVEQFQHLTHKFCISPELANFINVQVSQTLRDPQRRQFSSQFIYECLGLYFAGSSLYKQKWMRLFNLPSPQVLYKSLKDVKVNLKSEQFFEILRKKVNCLQEKDKTCGLLVKEMSIKPHFFYNTSTDTVIGLAQNSNGKKIFKPAQNVLVLMIKGLTSNWKQIIAYIPSFKKIKAKDIKTIIYEAVNKLENVGLRVCTLTTDMSSNNIKLTKELNITESRPWFYINGKKITYIFDIPHIFNAIRNTLLKHNFVIKKKMVAGKYVKKLYDDEKYSTSKSVPKLCESHIWPSKSERRKVKFATQVFSSSVSNALNMYIRFGIISNEALETANFIDTMDKLFDLLNSSSNSSSNKFKKSFEGLEYQVSFLKNCLIYFKNISVVDMNNRDVTNKVKCIKYIRYSINGILSLWDSLQSARYPNLFTRRIHLDPLVNFLNAAWTNNGQNKKPTLIKFHRCFKKEMRLNLFNSGIEHCMADFDPILLRLGEIPRDEPISVAKKNNEKICTEYRKNSILQNNFRNLIFGYVMKQTLSIHSCGNCESIANALRSLDERTISYYRTFNNFVSFLIQVENRFQEHFEECVVSDEVVSKFVTSVTSCLNYNHSCKEFPISYAVKFYLRVKLYVMLQRINENLKNKYNIV